LELDDIYKHIRLICKCNNIIELNDSSIQNGDIICNDCGIKLSSINNLAVEIDKLPPILKKFYEYIKNRIEKIGGHVDIFMVAHLYSSTWAARFFAIYIPIGSQKKFRVVYIYANVDEEYKMGASIIFSFLNFKDDTFKILRGINLGVCKEGVNKGKILYTCLIPPTLIRAIFSNTANKNRFLIRRIQRLEYRIVTDYYIFKRYPFYLLCKYFLGDDFLFRAKSGWIQETSGHMELCGFSIDEAFNFYYEKILEHIKNPKKYHKEIDKIPDRLPEILSRDYLLVLSIIQASDRCMSNTQLLKILRNEGIELSTKTIRVILYNLIDIGLIKSIILQKGRSLFVYSADLDSPKIPVMESHFPDYAYAYDMVFGYLKRFGENTASCLRLLLGFTRERVPKDVYRDMFKFLILYDILEKREIDKNGRNIYEVPYHSRFFYGVFDKYSDIYIGNDVLRAIYLIISSFDRPVSSKEIGISELVNSYLKEWGLNELDKKTILSRLVPAVECKIIKKLKLKDRVTGKYLVLYYSPKLKKFRVPSSGWINTLGLYDETQIIFSLIKTNTSKNIATTIFDIYEALPHKKILKKNLYVILLHLWKLELIDIIPEPSDPKKASDFYKEDNIYRAGRNAHLFKSIFD